MDPYYNGKYPAGFFSWLTWMDFFVAHKGGINGDHEKFTTLRDQLIYTLLETNIAPKMDGWKTAFLFRRPIFRGELLVLGRVASWKIHHEWRCISYLK